VDVAGFEGLTIHILSDSLGETADMVARAAAAQFAPGAFRVERLPKVSSPKQLRELVRLHCGPDCIFFFTLVEPELLREMYRVIEDLDVNGCDILGPPMRMLEEVSGESPKGEAGLVRLTDRGYFDKIEALEFAVKHDDGRNPQGLGEAEIVLIGVSRTSKTPLSMYLAFKGYRTANVPLTLGTDPPKELFEVDSKRVFGLVADAALLSHIRTQRMQELGSYVAHYAEQESVERELEEARAVMRRIGCIVLRTDNRAIEETAQEILRYAERAFE
jgi:regulator of PEP synthase PpsR (kinase-PPPase family)